MIFENDFEFCRSTKDDLWKKIFEGRSLKSLIKNESPEIYYCNKISPNFIEWLLNYIYYIFITFSIKNDFLVVKSYSDYYSQIKHEK